MSQSQSPYYPPRARWNRHLYRAAYFFRRQLHLEDLKIPLQTTLLRFLLSFVVPGFSFFDAELKLIGRLMMVGWVVAGCVFLIWLGYSVANVAFGLMMSVHVSSVLYVLNRLSPGLPVVRRLVLSIAVLFVIGQLIYASGLNWLQNHWCLPLRKDGKVYVINCAALSGRAPRTGDLIAYQSQGASLGAVRIRG